MEVKNLYVLSFCAIKKDEKDSDLAEQNYSNLCVSPDREFLSFLIECFKATDEFRDLMSSTKFGLDYSPFEYHYRISDLPLKLVL